MDSAASSEPSPTRIRLGSNSSQINSPQTAATGNATFSSIRHALDIDIDLAGAPFYFNPDDGFTLTTMEQALRAITNFSRPNSSSRDDTINCKEWLLYIKCMKVSIDSSGESVDLKNRISVISSFHDSKHMLLVPNDSIGKSWMSSIYHNSANSSSRKCRNEAVYNLYDFYGHDVLHLDLHIHRSYLSNQSCLARRTIPLCYFYEIQKRQNFETDSTTVSQFTFPMEVLFEVPSADLTNAGIAVSRNNSNSSNGRISILRLHLRFRLVSLRQCCRLSLYRHPNDSILSIMNSDSYAEEVHDLHIAAAYGPPLLLAKLLQSLARKSYLRRSMQLQSVCPSQSDYPSIISFAKNAVDLTLTQGNYSNAKLLFERMGNLCFLGSLIGSRSCSLHYAVFGGNVKCVELVLKYVVYYGPIPVRGVRDYSARLQDVIEWRDENDYTPLLLACRLSSVPSRYGEYGLVLDQPSLTGRTRIVSLLLRFRADASVISSKTSKTALLLACLPGLPSQKTASINMDVIRILFQAKKSRAEISALLQSHPNLASNHSYRRWNCCLWSCYCKLPIISFFFTSHKSSPPYTVIDSSNELSYDELVNSDRPYDSSHKTRRIPLLFLKCDIFHKDLDNKTAFTYAVESGNLPLVKLMIWCGVSYMDILDGDGNNIIHLCAKYGHSDLVEYIAELEYDRYKKYRYYVQRFPLQLIHYRMQIFRMKNALGLSPYAIAQYAERDQIRNEDNRISLLSTKIDYYCQLIYQPPVTSKSLQYIDFHTARERQLASASTEMAASSENLESSVTAIEIEKKALTPSAHSATSAWHTGPFSALFSILLPSNGSGKHGSESYLKSTLQSTSVSTNLSNQLNRREQLADSRLDGSEELEYDDEADDLAYEFSLAPKGIVSQNYYSVAQYANAKLSADDDENSTEMEATSRETHLPAIAVIE